MSVKSLFSSLMGEHIPAEKQPGGIATPGSFLCDGYCDTAGECHCDNSPDSCDNYGDSGGGDSGGDGDGGK